MKKNYLKPKASSINLETESYLFTGSDGSAENLPNTEDEDAGSTKRSCRRSIFDDTARW